MELTKQSLDERFNTFAARFMRQCYELLFRQVLGLVQQTAAHTHFFKVILTDSTSWLGDRPTGGWKELNSQGKAGIKTMAGGLQAFYQ